MGVVMLPLLVLGFISLPVTLPVMIVQQMLDMLKGIFDFDRLFGR